MHKKWKSGVVVASLLVSGCLPKTFLPLPPKAVGTSNGSVVALSRIITELKCDVRSYQALIAQRSPRLEVGNVGVELVLSLSRDGQGGFGGTVGVPIAATGLSLKAGASKSREVQSQSSTTMHFILFRKLPSGQVEPPNQLNCDNKDARLPQEIIPLTELERQLEAPIGGQPYMGLTTDIEIKGKFYLKETTAGQFSVVSIPATLDLAKSQAVAEYTQSFDIFVNVAKITIPKK